MKKCSYCWQLFFFFLYVCVCECVVSRPDDLTKSKGRTEEWSWSWIGRDRRIVQLKVNYIDREHRHFTSNKRADSVHLLSCDGWSVRHFGKWQSCKLKPLPSLFDEYRGGYTVLADRSSVHQNLPLIHIVRLCPSRERGTEKGVADSDPTVLI